MDAACGDSHSGADPHQFQGERGRAGVAERGPCEASAQADVLVSNLRQGERSTATVGERAGIQITVAVGFETGSHTKSYTLASIKADLSDAVPGIGVQDRRFDAPGSSTFTFDNPTFSNGTRTFTAPTDTTLRNSTLHFLVFDSTASTALRGSRSGPPHRRHETPPSQNRLEHHSPGALHHSCVLFHTRTDEVLARTMQAARDTPGKVVRVPQSWERAKL